MSATPPYSVQFLASMERTITKERLTRDLSATRQDVSKALQLYEYNVQLSEVLYGLLHGLEVTVRNAEPHALTASHGRATWYDIAPLSPYWKDQLANAGKKPGVAGKPGKVLTELTFGPRDEIHQRLKTIQLLRNRISHHEPVLTAANTIYSERILREVAAMKISL